MKTNLRQFSLLFALLILCGPLKIFATPLSKTDGPVKVQILQTNGGYQLYVDHHPFYIRGAGLESGDQQALAECGGNSFRTWSTEDRHISGQQMLDRAEKNGLYVTMGLEMGRERLGFNYDDPATVARQRERIRKEVLKYKDHPALIIWAIGNELNLDGKNPKVWDAVNDISKMIHEIDPNHLTTTPLAGFNRGVVDQVKHRAPDLDLLSFQMYGDIVNLPRYLRDSDWSGPYLVTEWGATGHWEVRKTEWGAPIEENSTVKANMYLKRFQTAIESDHKKCVGSYVFLWGNKQERTPTWYGMFLRSGEETASIDTMQYVWTGSWPAVRSPKLVNAWLDGKTAYQNIHLVSGQVYRAKVQASDDQNPLSYSWSVMEESTDLKTGGDAENTPKVFAEAILNDHDSETSIKAPARPGAYRLFGYVYDGKGHAAHVNIPFYVDSSEKSSMINAQSVVERQSK